MSQKHLSNPEMYCASCNHLLYLPVMLHEQLGNMCLECYIRISHGYDVLARNFALEVIIMGMDYPCALRQYGCPFFTLYSRLGMHLKYCMYKRTPCLANRKCSWVGQNKDLPNHFDISHSFFIFKSLTGFEFVIFLKFRKSFHTNILLTGFFGIFLMQICKEKNFLYYTLSYVAKSTKCSYFKYKIEKMFYKEEFTLEFNDTPVPIEPELKINYINKNRALKIKLNSVQGKIYKYKEAYLLLKLYDCKNM